MDTKQETIEGDLDKEAWFPEKITELTRQGVLDPVAQCVSLLPHKSRYPLLRRLEQDVMKEVMTWGVSRQARFRKKMDRLPRKLQVEIGQDDYKHKNIAWSGTKTWGCSYGAYLLIASRRHQEAPPLRSLLFPNFKQFFEWVSRLHKADHWMNLFEGWGCVIDNETCPDEIRQMVQIAKKNRIEFTSLGKNSHIISIRQWLLDETPSECKVEAVVGNASNIPLQTFTFLPTGNQLVLGSGGTITINAPQPPPATFPVARFVMTENGKVVE